MFKQLMLAAVLFATPAFACQEDVSKIPGLNDQERAALVQKCEAAKTEVKEAVVEAVKEPEKVATQVSTASTQAVSVAKQAAEVVKVANELSVAVNEFITTPVGVLATGVAVWYFAGDQVHAVMSALWDMIGGVTLIVIATIIGSAIRRGMMFKEAVSEVQKGWFGSEKTVQRKTYHSFASLEESDMQFGVVLTMIGQGVCYLLGFLMVF